MRKSWIALVVVVALTACQKDEALEPHQTANAGAPAAAAEPAPVPVEAPAQAATTAPPVASTPGGVASTDGEQSGVTLNVTEFKRSSGDTVTLKFVISNNGSEPFDFGYNLGDPAVSSLDFASVGGVHLIDPVGKKKYFVVRDSDNRCVCSRELKRIDAGKQLNLWAKFPAPVDAQRVSIVVPHFLPLDDVPIS